jgi:hypothetical protein
MISIAMIGGTNSAAHFESGHSHRHSAVLAFNSITRIPVGFQWHMSPDTSAVHRISAVRLCLSTPQ